MSGINPNTDVIIRIKGLGIGYYNRTNNPPVWEFIFLRKIPNHDLKITVIEHLTNGTKRETPYSPGEDIKEIDILSTGHENVPHQHQPEGNRFRRDENHNHYDSRWFINLSSELHNSSVKLRKKSAAIGLTYMKINGATLYTHGRTDPLRPYRIVKKGAGGGSDTDIASSPRVVGHFLGLDIDWKNAGTRNTTISYAGSSIPSLVPDNTIDYYEISIDNDCPQRLCPPEPDFHYYYDYLVDMPDVFNEIAPNSSKFSLKEFLLNRFGIEDTRIESDRNESSFLDLMGLSDIFVTFAGKTDCHLALVDDLAEDRTSLRYLIDQ